MAKRLVLFCFSFVLSWTAFAQEDVPLSQSKQYTIGGINVVGAQSYNEQTIIAFTGLSVGEKIYLPGDKLSRVIQKLWDLGLFSNINVYRTKIVGDRVFLEFKIEEIPEIKKVKISGVDEDERKKIIEKNDLEKGTKATENLVATTENSIERRYKSEGYLNAEVEAKKIPVQDTTKTQEIGKVNIKIHVDKGPHVKITEINIHGNEVFSDWKVHRQMSNTKEKFFLRFWKRSEFVREEYKKDKQSILEEYKSKGYRDARIVWDSISRVDNDDIAIDIKIEEGDKYYFGDIKFIGNSAYSDRLLHNVLTIQKGDTYNGVLLHKRVRSLKSRRAQDISSLYTNNGYLFSRINVVETKVYNDTIDFEIRIHEGKVAYFDEIIVKGNSRTNDDVVYRNLRTQPGEKYSRQAIMRSVRELGQLGFFDARKLKPKPENINPTSGTLDLVYHVAEKGASQIQLQGGYGGGGFVGTIGLSFNNFSIGNIFNAEAYHPLPMGDGQTLSIRAQASSFYQTYSLSFTEPWLGGTKPIRLTTSFSHTIQYAYDFAEREANRDRKFLITGGSVGIAKRLQWPDNFFTLSTSLSFRHYDLKNYNIGLFSFPNGVANNFAITLGITRDNTATNPIFPTSGSKFSLTAKLTPPYSLWNGVDYGSLKNKPAYQINGEPNRAKIDQKRFRWLEYYKVEFSGEWYNKLIGKFVLKTNAEFGFLGAYNSERGIPPFERFYLGGDGLGGYSLDGRETIRLRGYGNQSLTPVDRDYTRGGSRNIGATIYSKYTLELRYPITLNPSASIYALTFAEAGATYDNFSNFNPFEVYKSAGFGVRVYMPAFGLLGIDFGYGFDPIPGAGAPEPNGWETHFIIGQQF